MKVAVRDREALRSLSPLEVSGYLRATGWRHEAELPSGKGSLWLLRRPGGGERDVTLPARREFADYALRISELLRTLADSESRSEFEILQDVQAAAADVVRVRAIGRDAEDGSLPLEQGVAFVQHSRDMVLAAACAAISKRSVFAKRKPQQAMDYLGHVRMGQTERGSYVLTIRSPVAPELRPAQPAVMPEDPYERQVTRALVDGLHALDDASSRAVLDGDIRAFQAAVSQGVSANLCEAVAGLSASGAGGAVEIRVSWSRTRQVPDQEEARVVLGTDAIPLIEEAARRFRASAEYEGFELEGIVTRLAQEPGATRGDVTVSGSVDDRMRRVSLTLDAPSYGEAVQAHRERNAVHCTGELVREGRGYRLKNPRDFAVLNEG